ncbi:MAG TPA: hypothetical protein VKN99_04425 [Polyangia bacterium]|nr:hypothetical protein [Polyangia bacterium]
MDYLYADGTRFPLALNFIDVLRDTLDCAVELMTIHQRAQHARDEMAERERFTLHVLENLSDIENAISAAVERAGEVSERVRERIREATASIVATEKSSTNALLEQDTVAAARASAVERESMLRALERLLRRHDLPDSQMGLNLELPAGEGPYRGRVLVASSLGLDSMLVVDVPPGHRFARPLHVGEVVPGLAVSLELEGGVLSARPRSRRVPLDKLFVTEVGFATGRVTLGLRKKPESESAGFDFVMTTGQVVGVEVTRIREDGVPTAEPAQRLNLDDSRAIERLLEVLREAAFELGRHRGRLEQALLDGAPVDEAEGAAEIARRLVDMLAPYVTEIAKRGSGRGELALKRDLGGGRREEIYVSKATLCERIGQLEPAERAVFDPLGLGEGSRSGVINGGRSLPPTLPAAALR